jgi:protein subunit release factor B
MRKDLLFSITKKDLKIEYYSGKGGGGQHRNKHQNCVRLTHPDSGVTVVATEQKSRTQNLKMAFKRLVNHDDFRNWLRIRACYSVKEEDDIRKKVEQWMQPENLLIEEV